MKRLLLLPLLALAAAFPTRAQLGIGGPEGIRVSTRLVGGDWSPELGSGKDRLQVGHVGSGRPLDGLAVRHEKVPVKLQVRADGRWLDWAGPGQRAGIEGKPITGLRLRADGRSIRYRAAFAGHGITAWARDGDPCEAGGAPLEALDVELLDAAPKDAPSFEYRVRFAKSGFTPWLRSGEPAEGRGEAPAATAIQFRGGGGLRCEVRVGGRGWSATIPEGEIAGDAKGDQWLSALRVFSAAVPIRYRIRVEGHGWAPWASSGEETAVLSSGLRVEAVQVELKTPAE